jgi:prepilin-type N-terminal cleavage/methylation domain-containing protein
MNGRRAFTIIELVIVMLVMGILASAAAPRYVDALAAYRVNAAASRVAADLRMVRHQAQKTSIAQTLLFDAASNLYLSTTMADMNRPSAAYVVNLGTSEYATDVTATTFSGGMVQFDIYGRPTGAGSVSLRSGTRVRTVSVDVDGMVTVS